MAPVLPSFFSMMRAIVLVVALMALCACHRVTYTTNLPRGATTEVWNHHFVFGLFGFAEINARTICPGGVAQITAYQHITHILLTTVTIGIYSPRSVFVTCAAEATPPGEQRSAATRPPRQEGPR